MQAELDELLSAPDPLRREAAWRKLVDRSSRLLLAAARSLGGGHDAVMERYAYLLEKLAERDYQRLRAFRADGRASFTTWLTVAARRLCLDHHRARYGRTRATLDPGQAEARRAVRRRLADSLASEIDPDMLPASGATSAEGETILAERNARLHAALASLPPRDRLLLALRFVDDWPASRIARLAGFPTAFHVYRRLNAVLDRLRGMLEAGGIEDSAG